MRDCHGFKTDIQMPNIFSNALAFSPSSSRQTDRGLAWPGLPMTTLLRPSSSYRSDCGPRAGWRPVTSGGPVTWGAAVAGRPLRLPPVEQPLGRRAFKLLASSAAGQPQVSTVTTTRQSPRPVVTVETWGNTATKPSCTSAAGRIPQRRAECDQVSTGSR